MPVTINGTTGIAGPDGSASTPAVQGTDSNTGLFYPAADTVALSTGGSERMRIDSSGNVGIGTSSPSSFGTLAVQSANNVNGYFANSATSGSTASSQVRLATYDGSSVSVGSYFIETANSWSNTAFAGGVANTTVVQGTKAGGLSLISKASSAPIKFYLNGEASTDEKMRINYDGTIKTVSTISVGNATPSTSGAGITFPATQSASSDANTLDDYEEGTWTPSIGGTATYTTRIGTYRKIGSQVTCWFDVTINAVGTGSGALQGIPFQNNASLPGCGNVGYFGSLVASFVMINTIVAASGVSITFETATAATATLGDNQNIWQNGSRCTGFVTYHT